MRRPLVLSLALVVLASGACAGNPVSGSPIAAIENKRRGGMLIAGAVYPLSFLVERSVGDQARVTNLTKPGFEPHDAELTAGQVRTISRADLVIYLGGHFQPVVERAVAGLGDRALDVLPAALGIDDGGERHDGEDHSAAQTAPHVHDDPHVWLDPHRMQLMNGQIAGRLAALRPSASQAILSRAAATDAELRQLDDSFRTTLKGCRRRDFMTGHGAFGYLAERYGLKQAAIGAGFSESEPSPGRMAGLVVRARSMGIRTVFYERSTSPASAMTLAREIGADTAILDSIETAPPSGDYLSAMRRNLLALARALGC